ncbi:hypothetical protein A3J23_03520 [Candidatus Peregrinibacteria bacterium RIFCSPLOWO2_02_FULL_48_14]|nr:MAG: hypothetical protein A2974_00025 [Candidatus Peregrinibacteria bacterium RIFCSPLOWO2_01_FULL_48_20]OGJ43907.1 MAG: hypothetical protein A3J23_03520 [Candidatus Peregrinibacteria bacterium RIFCSPLOWO2_02_FULL_48_14]
MKPYFTEHFKRQLKKLQKKFPHIREDLLIKINHVDLSHEVHIGESVYKIRIKSRDMQKGSSGGFRSYLLLYRLKDLLVPLTIYAKNQKETISEEDLQNHVCETIGELLELFQH